MLSLEDMKTKKLRSLPELLNLFIWSLDTFIEVSFHKDFNQTKNVAGDSPQTKNTLFLCTMRRNY